MVVWASRPRSAPPWRSHRPPRGAMWPAELWLEDAQVAISAALTGVGRPPEPRLSEPGVPAVRPEAGGAQAEGAVCRRPGPGAGQRQESGPAGLTACPAVRTRIRKVWVRLEMAVGRRVKSLVCRGVGPRPGAGRGLGWPWGVGMVFGPGTLTRMASEPCRRQDRKDGAVSQAGARMQEQGQGVGRGW